MTVLSLSNISKRFGPTIALDGVNLQLRTGEVHALIGENGAGKSTLMNVLAGLVQPDEGIMQVDGTAYLPSTPLDARARGIALIHQELSLFPHLSVAENIMMGIEPARFGLLDQKKLAARVSEVLATFQHPEITPGARVSNLSIAARQIVEICRAIAARAQIILMDEPTSSLPRDDVQHLFSVIRKFGEQSLTVVYISHFLEEVREIADRFTVLRDGRSVATGPINSTSDEQLIAHMVGRPLENLTMTRFAACSRWGWLNISRQRAQTRELLNSLAVKARHPEQPVATLSGGNQQKIAVARLLHQDADILLLDEPTRGIDIGSKAVVYRTIAECAENGKAILMVSSYLPELFCMCDRLA